MSMPRQRTKIQKVMSAKKKLRCLDKILIVTFDKLSFFHCTITSNIINYQKIPGYKGKHTYDILQS